MRGTLQFDFQKIDRFFSDFEIKLVDLTSKSVKSLTGHDAPILSISIDPFVNFLV